MPGKREQRVQPAPPGRPLRALIVEDVEIDAQLLLRELARAGFAVDWKRVDNAKDLEQALFEPWDIVLSDWNMPGFNAKAALSLVKARGVDIPFVIVSGTVEEEIAVEALHAGAQDFFFKGKLLRLGAAVDRELKEVAIRAERRTLQEQLLLSDRMVSVGTLAAGVAHEINNPLAALMANVEFAIQELQRVVATAPPDLRASFTEVQEALHDAHESADRVRLIVRDVKVFSRPDEERRGPVRVHRVLESTSRMCWNEIRHRARLVKDFGPVGHVLGNEARLGQVFLNLMVNAAQAIPEGAADSNEIRVATWMNQGSVVIEVRDTGSGISPELLGRIFDPFFTTKPIGTGTGLGLAICQRIIAAMGGSIVVESRLGQGTSFKVMLPEIPAPVQDEDLQPVVVPLSAERARILVIDDESSVVSVVQRILSDRHDITGVTSGKEALALIDAGQTFDVLLCDVMMPEMTGMDVHEALRAKHPALAERMVFMSGGVFTQRARLFLDDAANRVIDKPFDVAALRLALQDCLSRNEGKG
jgi:signal transduction histidine kinase